MQSALGQEPAMPSDGATATEVRFVEAMGMAMQNAVAPGPDTPSDMAPEPGPLFETGPVTGTQGGWAVAMVMQGAEV